VPILLLGAQGQLGTALRHSLAGFGKLIAPPRAHCDLCGAVSLQKYLHATRPAIIINAAAYSHVDAAEDAPDLAMAVNANGPARLAEAANALGALLVHYSSDYVFDGTLGHPYVETDATHPVNAYGRSKQAGDAAAAQAARHLILRAGWLYGAGHRNFLATRLMQRQRVTVVSDQIGAPTSAAQLAQITAQLLTRYRCNPASFPVGLYHVAAAGQTSWYDYACYLAEQLGAAGVPLAANAVQAISSTQYITRAVRPHDTRLDTSRLRDTFAIALPAWQDDVARTLACLIDTHSNQPCTL